jgi:superfamily II DNA/RNA helicase
MLSSAPVAQPTSSPRAPRVEFRRRAPVGGGVQAIGAMAVRRALTRVAAVRAPQHLASRFAPAPSTSTRLATRVRTAFASPGRAFEPRRAFSAAAAARVAALGASADAPEPEAVPFASLEDAHPAVLASLSRLGFETATYVQSQASPVFRAGKDVVIAAETGSGKTLSYLVPIFSNLLRHGHGRGGEKRVGALILAPNASLVAQVAQVCDSLVDESGEPLLKTTGLTPDASLPNRDTPDVVVATPARAAEDLCRFSEGAWRRGNFSKNVTFIRHVVFDEADQLLSGGYLRPVRGIFDVLYREEKLAALGLTVDGSDESDGETEKGEEGETEKGWSGDAGRAAGADPRDWRADHSDVRPSVKNAQKAQISGKGKGPALGGKGEVGVGAGREFRRQYAFAAATVMSNGKKTPGAMIKYGFPDAVWVEGRRLHRAVPALTQTWVDVTDATRADALGAALGLGTANFRPETDCAKTMVFVNSAEASEAVAAELKRQGFAAEAFGAQCTSAERTERLRAFSDGSVSVLACTDAAARGVDVPGVAHVVQAEFAGNAVEYLHRIGRTARNGENGLVTNLVGEKDEELVRAVRDCEARGVPVEGAFSRKRSFRKKFKKYGESRTAPQNRR